MNGSAILFCMAEVESSDGFIRTIENDVDDLDEEAEDDAIVVNKSFTFDGLDEDPIQNAWDFNSALMQSIDKSVVCRSIDQLISRY